jgi:hypothetical protein
VRADWTGEFLVTASHNGQPPAAPREAAAYYLGRGFIPVPIPRTGNHKAPVLEGWQQSRPTEQDLDALFPANQPLNLGLLLGEPSGGLLDVDLDCAETIAAGAILLPNTALSSGRKSRMCSHHWYRVRNPPSRASTPYKDLEGKMLVELRSTGGQTIVWPSVHQSGERVGWHNLGEPAEVTLESLQSAVAHTAAAALLARYWPAKGGRQDAALALAGGLLRAGWDVGDTECFLRAVATASRDDEVSKRFSAVQPTAEKLQRQEPVRGWPTLAECLRGNGDGIIRRVREWEGLAERRDGKTGPKTTPRVIEPYQSFPVEALPHIIREHVVQGAAALGCDPAYLALPELTAAASAIGSTRTLVLKRGRRGWREPCILWTVIIGDSGTLKSPAWQTAVDPLFEEQRRLIEEYKQKAASYLEEMAAYKAAKKQFEKGEGADPGDPPEQPVLRRVVCSDTTIEKLAEILEDNPRGVLVARDELAGWLGSFQRYKGERGGSDLPNWLEMHRAGTIVVDRKTGDRRTLFIRPATVSVTGGIQPGVLVRYLTPEFLESGLAARLLMAMPMPREKRWSEMEIDLDTDMAYEGLLRDLFALDFGTDDQGRPIPHGLRLSPEAKAAWVAFYDAWAREQASAEGELAAAYSKLEAYTARFALLHHIVSRIARGEDECAPVEPESIQAGVTLARWFAREARRIHSLLTESQEERDTRRLVEFIRARGGRISVRKLQKSNSRKYPRNEDAEAALNALVNAGRGEWEPPVTTGGKGRPASRFFRLREEESPPDDASPLSSACSRVRLPVVFRKHLPCDSRAGLRVFWVLAITFMSVSFWWGIVRAGGNVRFPAGPSCWVVTSSVLCCCLSLLLPTCCIQCPILLFGTRRFGGQRFSEAKLSKTNAHYTLGFSHVYVTVKFK